MYQLTKPLRDGVKEINEKFINYGEYSISRKRCNMNKIIDEFMNISDASLRYRLRHWKEYIEYQNNYRNIHHKRKNELSSNWRKNHPEKHCAHQLAWKYCSLGLCCELCGSSENLERHHPDYSKPLEIVTLCKRCHEGVG